jgi:hypothetical protein
MFDRKKKDRLRYSESFGKVKSDSFNFELIERYFRNKNHSGTLQVLSDKTCKDLDFNEFFMFADRTVSRVGQQCLYNNLRTIPLTGDKLNTQEKLIAEIAGDTELRLKLQLHLDSLSRDNAFYISSLFHDEHLKKPKWFFIVPVLSFASFLSLLMLPFTPQFIFVLLSLFIINITIHFWNKRNLYEYAGSIPQLLNLNRTAKELMKTGLLSGFDRDLPDSIKVIDRVRNRMSFFKLEAKLESDTEIAFWAVLELAKSLFLLEPLLLFGVLEQLDTKRKEIEKVFSFVGYADTLISIASLRKGLDVYCLPELRNEGKFLETSGVYHPLIPECVPNSIVVDGKSILLTGSNMSGKTSFIRTIGLNAITALSINTCFAARFCLPRVRIFSAIRISDDLMNDRSYYFEEVLTIKEMIGNSRREFPGLFLLDEIFKGTNTIERISAGKAVLSYLNSGTNIVFVSTHDIELADMLDDTYELYHFSEQVENKTVDFDFRLKTGKLKNRNAIRILEINDYPEEIITEAMEISGKLDKVYSFTDKSNESN